MRYGLDVLGASQYADVIFKNVPKNVVLGVFALEFGDASSFVKAAISRGYLDFRIQMIWSHSNHSYGDSDLPVLNKLSRLYNNIAKANPHAKMALSPFCEHLIPAPDKYLDYVAKLAPNCEVVNSPVQIGGKKGGYSKRYKNEIHGSHAGPLSGNYNFSFDGNDAFNADIEGVKHNLINSDVFFLWAPAFNLHRDENDKERKSPPTSDYMRGVLNLMNTRAPCNLPANALWKPMSEKWKPVLITPIRTASVTLKKGSQVIEIAPYYGPYVDGRSRYYFKNQGYKLGACDIWINGKIYGSIDCGFRVNSYR